MDVIFGEDPTKKPIVSPNGDPLLNPDGSPNFLPPASFPLFGPGGQPVPLFGPDGSSLYGPENGVPLIGPDGQPIVDEDGNTVYGPPTIPLFGPGGSPVFGPGGIPLFGPGGVPLFDDAGEAIYGPENGTPILDENGDQVMGPEGFPLFGPGAHFKPIIMGPGGNTPMVKGDNTATIPIVATLPNGTIIENVVEMNVISPCADAETALISEIELSAYEYTLFEKDGPRSPSFSITHTEPQLGGDAKCGQIATRVEWAGMELGSTTTPIMYRYDQSRLGLYSEDPAFAGIQTLKFTNYLYEYPENFRVQEFELEVIDVCNSPPGINSNAENQVEPVFFYFGDFAWNVAPFVVEPVGSNCEVTYECAGEFCDKFDTTTLEWFMSNEEARSYDLGGHTMTITGTSGDKTTTYDFNILFADACTAVQTISPYEALVD